MTLSRLLHRVMQLLCFERFSWYLSIGFLSLQTWPVSFEPTKTKYLILPNSFYVQQNFWQKLLMLIKNNKWNDMVKEDVEDFGRRFPFHLTVLLKLFIHMTFANSLWKSFELFQIPCSCGRSLVGIIWCVNFLWLNLYVRRMSLSTIFLLLHLYLETLWF